MKEFTELFRELPKAPDQAHLTDSQMGIYLACMVQPESTMYNIPWELTLPRPEHITCQQVRERVDRVLACHPALLAHVEARGETPTMVRSPLPAGGLCTAREGSASAREPLPVRPFDLAAGPLCRVSAWLTEDKIYLSLDVHHIVADGVSVALLARQFAQALAGEEIGPEEVDAFSLKEAEDRICAGEAYGQAKDYFARLLAGEETDSNLIFDTNPLSDKNIPAGHLVWPMEGLDLDQALGGTGITKNTLFLGAFGYTLAKMTGQSRSVFGAVESGRHDQALDTTVSMLVKTLPVVVDVDETQSARTLLEALQAQFRGSIKQDGYPYTKLCQEYGLRADVLFVYQGEMLSGFMSPLGPAELNTLDMDHAMANLSMAVFREGQTYVAKLEYAADRYEEATIRRFARLFEAVTRAFARNAILREIPLADPEEVAALDAFQPAPWSSEGCQTIVARFRELAKQQPERIAVVFGDRRYTYAQADDLSDRLASYLAGQGIRRGQTVSILIPRCEWMVLASLGVMKAGAVYQPLDPTYPSERLTFLCQDGDSRLLIADRSLTDLLPEYTGPILYTDRLLDLPAPAELPEGPGPEDPYILLYTSGTTGTPKGCILNHENLAAFVFGYIRATSLEPDSRAAAYASYGFDAHMGDIYPTLWVGGQIHIIPQEMRLDLPALKAYFEREGITHTIMTTQLGRQFAAAYPQADGLRCLVTGGETLVPLDPPTGYTLINAYGPTEGTVCVTTFPVDRRYDRFPIGKAMGASHLYVVDPYDRRLPVGVPGELVVSGPQVGQGYRNRPEKTAQVFVPNTFVPDPEPGYERCYRTGDVVRFLEDGSLDFIGRRDKQVKIRGFRIELPEVEQVIREYPGIRDATVIAHETQGGKELWAYVVSDETVDIPALNRFIRQRKPAYMVPAAAMQLPAIPLTPNFKVDQRKLPEIEKAAVQAGSGPEHCATELEKALCTLVEEAADCTAPGPETDLADLGLTSISSIQLAVELYKQFGVHLTAQELLDGCSILKLENRIVAELLKAAKAPAEAPSPTDRKRYPLTQTQMGIYLECLRVGMDAYSIPMLYRLPEGIDTGRLKKAVEAACRAHSSMLCYVYADSRGEPVIEPQPDLTVTLEEETVSVLPPVPTAFAFDKTPLFRFRLLHWGQEQYLYLELHHIIGDGESMKVLLEDIDRAYQGQTLTPETYTAFQVGLEEEKARKTEALPQAREYYDSLLRGVSADYLPDGDREGHTCRQAGAYPLSVSAQAVQDFCQTGKISEAVLFTGAFALTVARFTAHEDALFATIHNGRTDPRTEHLVSMLVRTLPVFAQTPGEAAVSAWLQDLDRELKNLKKHDLYSFADAARDYGVDARLMFIYQGKLLESQTLAGMPLELIPAPTATPKAELAAELYVEQTGYRLDIEYNAGRYSEEWIAGFADAYAVCVENLLTAQTLGQVEITSEKALKKLVPFNDTAVPIDYCPAYALIEKQADLHPERLAVAAGDTELTYGQLDRMANALARQLRDQGVTPGSVVEILVDRTAEVYVAQLGILKAGCAFFCASPEYPDERIRYVTEDGNVKALVTTTALAAEKGELIVSLGLPVLLAEQIAPSVQAERLSLEVAPEALAYLIYTSGSTGKPKGVRVIQRGLVTAAHLDPKNTLIDRAYGVSGASAAVTAFTFDASVAEGFMALANGMTVCIAGSEEIHNPIAFRELCLKRHIISMMATPSFLLSLMEAPGVEAVVRNLRTVAAGGENFPPALYEKLRAMNPDLNIVNAYGPSEATITSACKVLDSPTRITIGTPVTNCRIYTLDRWGHILPMGALGEMTVVGETVGTGYLNREDLTKKSFITLLGQPAFRTGDLAIITHSGELDYHGRMDNQVKLRGLRVELGEIESAINACSDVITSIVTVHGDEHSRFLAAYFTARREIDPQQITAEISRTLAEYMVPRVLMQLPQMPLTANGKIDKKALPQPEQQTQAREYVAPATETETLLCRAFGQALGLDQVGVTEDFFRLGGTSLTATRVAMFAMAHDISIVYADIFKHPTARGLAALAEGSQPEAAKGPTAALPQKAEPCPENALALAGNVWSPGDDPGSRPLGTVLLTGATGYLGIHILHHFLASEQGEVYCLLRSAEGITPEQRLMGMYIYYFEQSPEALLGSRIHCISGDITDADSVAALEQVPFDTLINCAACVKHFANDDRLEQVNVRGVEHLIRLCQKTGRRLIQISTTSVAGEGIGGTPAPDRLLHENELDMGQLLENQYIAAKYQAEELVLRAVAEGMDGKILRAGNLMPRRSDGEFQLNYHTSGFMRRLKGYYALGCIPYSALSGELEFSPIDETAGAMLCLAETDRRFTVFHANNTHRVMLADVVRAMNAVGLTVQPVEEQVFAARLREALADPDRNQTVGGLIAYLNHEADRYPLGYDNLFTQNVLNRLGYVWHLTEDSYLENALRQLRALGFFDLALD